VAFARPRAGIVGIHVITPSRGLLPPWQRTTLATLTAFAKVPIDLREPRYTKPAARHTQSWRRR
jgi:hypothetical protein